MKISNYLWAVLATATLSLTACGSDENENVIQSKEKTAKLELTLVGTPADSRATGTLPTTDESQINRLTVAVFTEASGNPVNALREFTGGGHRSSKWYRKEDYDALRTRQRTDDLCGSQCFYRTFLRE